MPPKSVTNRRVLVTGAASGIGRATAVASARKGARLFLTDINEAPLQAVAHYRATDLPRHRDAEARRPVVLAGEAVQHEVPGRLRATLTVDSVEVPRAGKTVTALHARASQSRRRAGPGPSLADA